MEEKSFVAFTPEPLLLWKAKFADDGSLESGHVTNGAWRLHINNGELLCLDEYDRIRNRISPCPPIQIVAIPQDWNGDYESLRPPIDAGATTATAASRGVLDVRTAGASQRTPEERLLEAARLVMADVECLAEVTLHGKPVSVKPNTGVFVGNEVADEVASCALIWAIQIGSSFHTGTGAPASAGEIAQELRDMGANAAADWMTAQGSAVAIHDPEWVDCCQRWIDAAAAAVSADPGDDTSLVVQALRPVLQQLVDTARAPGPGGRSAFPFAALQAISLGLSIEMELSCAPAPADDRTVELVVAVVGAGDDDGRPDYGRVTIDAVGLHKLLEGHRAMRSIGALGTLLEYPVAWDGMSPATGAAMVHDRVVAWHGEDLAAGARWETELVDLVELTGRWVRSKPGDVIDMTGGAPAACEAAHPGM